MFGKPFRAVVTRADGQVAKLEELSPSSLPSVSVVKRAPGQCDTIVKVEYSSLNFKVMAKRKEKKIFVDQYSRFFVDYFPRKKIMQLIHFLKCK